MNNNALLALKEIIRNQINISEEDLNQFSNYLEIKPFNKKDFVSKQGDSVNEIYFLASGFIAHTTIDNKGKIHTTHFASNGQFLGDYSALISKSPAKYSIEVMEYSEIVIISNEALEWFYKNIKDGVNLARHIWNYFYLYLDQRLYDTYTLTPKERYDKMDKIFLNIHQRVPQHMIASYIGISKVHLSRLKNHKT